MKRVFRGGLLIDGTGKKFDDASVVVEGRQIVEAGPAAALAAHETNSEIVDTTGMTMMPGLIDLHVHLHGQAEAEQGTRTRLLTETDAYQAVILAENAHRTLDAGFTTIRDMGAPNDVNIDIARAIADGVLEGPHVVPVATIRMTTRSGGYDVHGTKGGVTGTTEARSMARQKIGAGAEVIHVVATGASFGQFGPHTLILTIEEMRAAIEEAIKLGKRTTAHACGAQGMKNAVLAGTQCVEHGQWLYADPELIAMMRDRRVAWVPTLMNNPAKLAKMQEAAAKGTRCGLPAYVEERVPEMVEAHRRSFETAMEAGLIVPLGTDCGAPFTPNGTNAKEMEFFVEYGASPMQAIEAGTRIAAEVLGVGDRVGTLERSKQADMLIVKGNPLKDIRLLQDLSSMVMVVQAGNIVRDKVCQKTPGSGTWQHTSTPVEA
jgi:imidazolonepropionase-like amidohydrolase